MTDVANALDFEEMEAAINRFESHHLYTVTTFRNFFEKKWLPYKEVNMRALIFVDDTLNWLVLYTLPLLPSS